MSKAGSKAGSKERSKESRPAWAAPAWLAPTLVAVVTFVAFLPALQGEFVAWDDDSNFLNNPHYRGLGLTQLKWMWSTFHLGHYIPLSWMTFGLDYLLWGMNPAGYHVVNVLLHALDAVLVYFVARRLFRLTRAEQPATDSGLVTASAFAALFFAIHPLRVESVAWITERRDMLSLFFYLSSLLCYLRATDTPGRFRRWYVLALATFICALLSKGIAVTLPAVLLILNVYPLRRLGGAAGWWSQSARRVYLELLPFFLLSAAASLLSILALHPGKQLGVAGKAAVSAYSVSFYLLKTALPVNLSPLYEMPKKVDPAAAVYVVSYAVALSITALVVAVHRKWPGVTAAWLAFLVIILPLLGVVQNGPQIAADRYTYHAAPALAIIAGSVFLMRRRAIALALGAGVLGVLGILTWNQTRYWRNSERLWSRVLQMDGNSSLALTALANLFIKQDRLDDAIALYRRSIAIDSLSLEADNNLGIALARQGKLPEAIEHYRRAVAIDPAPFAAHNNWGSVLARTGDLAGAIDHYRQALAINPDFADAHVNLGNALVRLNRPGEALPHYQDAARIKPDLADAHLNWGVALAQQGKLAEAIEQFQKALAIRPDMTDARTYRDRALELLARR